MSLNAILKKENESLIGLVLPEQGKMPIDDLCSLLGIKSTGTIKKIVNEQKITYHKVGGKWVIDLADFWRKTESNMG